MNQVFKISSFISFLFFISSSILAQVDIKEVANPYSKMKGRYSVDGYEEKDSTLFDYYDFWNHLDRRPEFYDCSTCQQLRRFQDYLKTLLEYSTGFKIEEIKMKSSYVGPYRRGVYRKEYRTRFRIHLDENGNVSKTRNISNTHESIDTLTITNFLKNTVWRPGLKNMTPVKSVFILDIKFDSSICKFEYLSNAKKDLYNKLKYQIDEVESVYYEKEMIWDQKHWTLIQNVTSDSEMENIIVKVKSDLDSHLNQMEQEYLALTKDKVLTCDDYRKSMSELKNKKRGFVDELLRTELTKLSKK